MSAILSPGALVCPRCGRGYVVPGTTSADQYGVCETCYRRAQAKASDQYAEELEARKEYDAARQRKARAKRKAGSSMRVFTGELWD